MCDSPLRNRSCYSEQKRSRLSIVGCDQRFSNFTDQARTMTVKRTLQQKVSLLVNLSEPGFDGHGRKVDPETSNLGGRPGSQKRDRARYTLNARSPSKNLNTIITLEYKVNSSDISINGRVTDYLICRAPSSFWRMSCIS